MSRGRATSKSGAQPPINAQSIEAFANLEDFLLESEDENVNEEEDLELIYGRIHNDAELHMQTVHQEIESKRAQLDIDMSESINQQGSYLLSVKNELLPAFASTITRLKKLREDLNNDLEALKSGFDTVESSGLSMNRDLEKYTKQEADALKNELLDIEPDTSNTTEDQPPVAAKQQQQRKQKQRSNVKR